MDKYGILDRCREFIGHIAWIVFLWSIKMTENQYIHSIIEETLCPRKGE
jgi:hypothetical protein